MTEQEKEIAALKERVAHLEGIVQQLQFMNVRVGSPLPVWPQVPTPNTGTPTFIWPTPTVTC